MRSELLAEDSVRREPPRDPLARSLFRAPIGDRHGRTVRLGFNGEGRSKVPKCDSSGSAGELLRRLEEERKIIALVGPGHVPSSYR